MRRHAKAPSAASTHGTGNRSQLRSAAATRGRLGGTGGSGAPANRGSRLLALLVLSFLLTFVVGVALALGANKKVDSFIGSPSGATGVTGGLFNTPRGVAINQTGAGGASAGDYYVVDSTNNRIQQFTSAGAFVRAWGTDVVASGAGNGNEMQAVTVNATAGQFTLSFGAGGPGVGTTADIAFNATASQVQSALNALTNISTGGGSVSVSGGPGEAGGPTPYLVNFNGAPLAGTNVAAMTGAPGTTPLSGGTGVGADAATVTTFAEGAGAVAEICEVAANCKAGTTAATGGGMSAPQGIAVNQANGNVYVSDQSLRRIDQFDAKGNFIRAWGTDVVASGPHNNGTGFEICTAGDVCKTGITPAAPITGGAFGLGVGNLAVAPVGSPNAGDVYVADQTNLRIQEFSAAGAFLRTWGKGVDETEAGEGFEICSASSGHVCKVGVAGTEVGAFGSTNSATRIAVDSTGKVFATDVGNRRIQTFGPSGTGPASFYAAGGEEVGPSDVAIGPANSVFVLHPCPGNAPAGENVCGLGTALGESRLKEFNSAGVLQSSYAIGTGLTATASPVNNIAANLANDKVYFSTSGTSTAGNRVWTLDNDGAVPAPAVTLNPPAEVGAHSATFSGSITPNGPAGLPTSYHFEYSKNGVNWTPVAADVSVGEGLVPVSVPAVAAQGEATGLQANTLYRVRIVAAKAFGAATTTSTEQLFYTDTVGPEVQTLYPQTRTDTSARLTGLLGANNLPTTYHFEIGPTTAYGTNLPIPDGTASDGVVHLVVADANGLEPEGKYHYRLVATNAEGTTKGEDVSFEMRAAGSSASSDRAYEMVTPPFKTAPSSSLYGPFANPGFPSLSGDRMLWSIPAFPLNNEVEYPYSGDVIAINRTPEGWVSKTMLTHRPPVYEVSVGAKTAQWGSASGDLGVQTWTATLAMLPFSGTVPNGSAPKFWYTRRDGTGDKSFTAWNPNTLPIGIARDSALFNEDGSWMARWGEYRGVVGSNPSQDPSLSQLPLPGGSNGGQTIYLQKDAPTGAIELVNGCTGSGAEATLIPARVGTGAAATDTIGTQQCGADVGVLAEGAGTRTSGSPTLTGVSTASGAFAVGQVISGLGIPGGTVINAVGVGTLTLSANATCGGAIGNGLVFAGSNELKTVTTSCGSFQVGQTITGTGIPAATTITAVGANTLTLSAPATASTNIGGTTLTVSAPTATSVAARAQSIVSFRGATLGGSYTSSTASGVAFGPADTAMSTDGRRVFFESPDPGAQGVPTACASTAGSVGILTSCPPQLYVRQYDSNHENPVVRWISRSAIAGQQIGLMGTGVGFQGASRDGSVVYFRTNAPLTADDPNGAGVAPPPGGVVTGTASVNSTDLYQYKLPVSGDPSGGTLTRITGGPAGTSDSGGANARFISDDGHRVYFVTNSPIAGADSSAPLGGTTVPGGTPTGTVRDLYVFDDTKVGADRYRFIAQLPSASSCATENQFEGASVGIGANRPIRFPYKCFRGPRDGSVVAFMTAAKLTADDTDSAEDIYLYDYRSDELTRVSAPPPGASSYQCQEANTSPVRAQVLCNGDFGADGWAATSHDTKRGWGGDRQNNIGVDADGRVSVYFQSRSQLVPEDTNGAHYDTYQWREGKVTLISPGDSPDDAFYSGNGLDGRDVFFQTSRQIDPRDVSSGDYDIYDARVGGGIPYTPPATPCDVLGLKCEGNATPAPSAANPASRDFNGDGNVVPSATTPKCAKGKVRKNGKCVKKPKKPKQQKKQKRTANGKQGSGK